VAASYFKTAKAAGKDVKPPAPGPACADPGPFAYTPAAGFSGSDQFAYIATTGTAPNKKAVVSITVYSDILFTTNTTEPACHGDANGQIVILASGGHAPLTYSITGSGGTFGSSNTFSGLTGGTYNIAVKDADGYIRTNTVTLTDPATIAFSVNTVNNACNGTSLGSITVNASGGTGSISYSKDNGANFVSGNQFTSLSAGSYQVIVRDGNNCQASQAVVLTDPAAVSFTTNAVNNACNGTSLGSISVNASGGSGQLQYSKDGGANYQSSNVFSGLPAGSYSIRVKDANECGAAAQTVTLTDPSAITYTTTIVNNACNDGTLGSITFNATGGTGTLNYSINNGVAYQASNLFSNLSAGAYQLLVKDANGCLNAQNATLSDPPVISFTTVVVDNACNGTSLGSITVNASGGTGTLTYSKNNGGVYQASNLFSALAGGTYQVRVKDANNCSVVQAITLTDPAVLAYSTTNVNITCNGGSNGSITFGGSGGTAPYTYSITGVNGTYQSSTAFSSLTANTYNVAINDAHNCTAVGTVTLTQPAAVTVSGAASHALSYNSAMTASSYTQSNTLGTPVWSSTGLPAGLSLNSSSGQLSGTPLATGIFNAVITVTGSNGCTGSKSVTITVAPNLAGDTYASVVGNTQLVADGQSAPATPFTASGTNILANDQSDAAISITAVSNAATAHGTITIDANGKFTYSPAAGYTGTDSYVYTGTSSGVTATATISFTVSNMVWYVNNSYGGGGSTGTSNKPFTDVASAASASSAGQVIYVHTGSGNTGGNAVLKTGQTLRGAGTALNVGALSLAATTLPTLSGTITLAGTTTVDGFNMSTGNNTALLATGATSVAVNIQSISSSAAASTVSLATTSGNVSIAGGTITGGAGAPFNINGGSVNFTYSGSASQAIASQPLVNVSGGHTGTITFQTGTLGASAGTGLLFDNADGSYNFNGTTTLNGGSAGVNVINGSGGSFTFATGTTITSPADTAFNVLGGTAAITYNGNITQGNNFPMVSVSQGHATGTIAFQGTLSATNGSGLQFDNADGTYNFNTISGTTTLNGGDAGIDILNGSAGTFSWPSSTAITNPANEAIKVSAGTATVTYSGSFSKSNVNTTGITISSNTGGTITINGTGTKSINSGTAAAINLSSNTGATINFSGNNLVLNSTTGAGFTATAGGTISVAGTGNTITSTTGTALNVNATTISATGLTFKSIAANGAVNGIALNNTGSLGGVTVSGNAVNTVGGDNSGGVIQNTTGAGILLTNTTSPSFTNMSIQTTALAGVSGTTVTNFTFNYGKINNSGSSIGSDKSNIYFGTSTGGAPTDRNVSGVIVITGNQLTNAFEHGIDIQNYSGTISNATITSNTITSSSLSANSKGSGIRLLGFGSASGTSNITKATISSNTISNFPSGAGITAQYGNGSGTGGVWGTPGDATNVILIQSNSINGFSTALPMNTNGVLATLTGNGQAAWKIDNNTMSKIAGSQIGCSVRGVAPNATCDITNNSITGMTSLNAQAIAYAVDFLAASTDAPQLTGTISGNTITGQDGVGIQALATSNNNGVLNVTIKNNNVAAPNCGGCNRYGIRVDAGGTNPSVAGVRP
ncbi:MAG: hypothetical protein EOP50_01330, partial [Sphingobacteriales bacterium]